MSLSIIIPTLNEAAALPGTLDRLETEGILKRAEVLVADGGSTDSTVELAMARGIQVVTGDRSQRANQLNRGVAASTGSLLLFLHADTLVTSENVDRLLAAFASHPESQGGGFFRRFDRKHWFLAITGWMADRRSREKGLFIGDQAMFCRRSAFDALGGFDETMDVGEDFDFSLRLRERGPVIALGPTIVSSARRFERRGVIRQTMADRRWCDAYLAEKGWEASR